MDEPTPARSSLPWPAVVVATVLALVAAGFVIALGTGDDETSAPPVDGALELTPADATPGDPFEAEIIDADGTRGTLADRVGEPMVVNFFASWCTPCITEMPDLEAAHREVGDDIHFVGLAVQDRPEDAERITEDTGITYDWARDPRGDVANAIGVTQMPTTVFISADGEVVHRHSGVIDDDELLALIDEHLGSDR